MFIDGVSWLGENLKNYSYPCLILHGGDDRIVDKASARYLYENVSSKDKGIKIYDGFFHEILNEAEKDQVLSDIQHWIDERI